MQIPDSYAGVDEKARRVYRDPKAPVLELHRVAMLMCDMYRFTKKLVYLKRAWYLENRAFQRAKRLDSSFETQWTCWFSREQIAEYWIEEERK